ncbi:MAG: hypothetical protein KME12_03365 [Trichocoleus desertorum ATA4-8-CV12]|jgi:HEAT repeat protein|nr:hypothetical protein [Trichocoleus desertorum ATA4-8-CV12]
MPAEDALLEFKYQLLRLTGSDRAIALLHSVIQATISQALEPKFTIEAVQDIAIACEPIDSKAAVAELLSTLAHPNVEVQSWAAWALSQIGGETSEMES